MGNIHFRGWTGSSQAIRGWVNVTANNQNGGNLSIGASDDGGLSGSAGLTFTGAGGNGLGSINCGVASTTSRFAVGVSTTWNSTNPAVYFNNTETGPTFGNTLLVQGGADNASSKTVEVKDLSGNTDFVILGTGLVGIGATTPYTNLQVRSAAAASAGIQEALRIVGAWGASGDGPLMRFTNYHASGSNPNALEYNLGGIQGRDFASNWGGGLAFQTPPASVSGGGTLADRMVIREGGNVGIGTTAPSALLSLTSTTGIARLDITGASSGYTRSDIVFYGGDTARGAGSYMFNAGADRNYFWGTMYGSQTNSDNFGVGRTENAALNVATADQGNACFMIRKGATTHGGADAAHGGVGFAAAGVYIDRNWGNYPGITVCSAAITETLQGEFRVHGSNHTWASYPTASGADFACNFRIDGATYYTSDARRKTNIETITGALATINRMEGRSFNTINSDLAVEAPGTLGGKQYGFIAQEVESIVPNSVKYYPAEDTPLENGWCRAYSFDYGGFTAVLVEAVKELTARLEALEAA